ENCNDREAEVFTATGNYGADCWQLITETGVLASARLRPLLLLFVSRIIVVRLCLIPLILKLVKPCFTGFHFPLHLAVSRLHKNVPYPEYSQGKFYQPQSIDLLARKCSFPNLDPAECCRVGKHHPFVFFLLADLAREIVKYKRVSVISLP